MQQILTIKEDRNSECLFGVSMVISEVPEGLRRIMRENSASLDELTIEARDLDSHAPRQD